MCQYDKWIVTIREPLGFGGAQNGLLHIRVYFPKKKEKVDSTLFFGEFKWVEKWEENGKKMGRKGKKMGRKCDENGKKLGWKMEIYKRKRTKDRDLDFKCFL